MTAHTSLHISGETLLIEGGLDFNSVVALQQQGDEWLRASAPQSSRLDLAGVTQCNSAATALLLDWLRTAKEVNKTLEIVNVPQRLADLMELAGLKAILEAT